MPDRNSEGVQDLVNPLESAVVASELPPESDRHDVGRDIRFGARLVGGYLLADRWRGGLLVALFIFLLVVNGITQVRFAISSSAITTAIAARQAAVMSSLIWQSAAILGLWVAGYLVAEWCRYTLRIRARNHATGLFSKRWLEGNRFYYLERRSKLDHPEQRIQEDTFIFVQLVLDNFQSLVGIVSPFFLFSAQLWRLSEPVTLLDGTLTIHGSLLFTVLGYAFLWTYLTHLMGKSLTRTEIVRQRLEALYRQEMATVRENGEAIAFERGGLSESARIQGTYGLIQRNWRDYTFANLRVSFSSSVPNMLMMFLPMVVCAPRVLNGGMTIGDFQLVGSAMLAMYGAAGIFISVYRSLAILRSATSRLRYFDEVLSEPFRPGIEIASNTYEAYDVRDLEIQFPGGKPMLGIPHWTIAPGDSLMIKGPSGSGKSTLLRALAGLWPYGSGKVLLPPCAKVSFLPQRSFMPDGTLAGLMAYPRPAAEFEDARYHELLAVLGLGRLVDSLHAYRAWKRELSPGEQQRIAIARVVLAKPDFLFLDEATSALDPESERRAYELIASRLPDAAVVSVAHRVTVEQFHTRVVTLAEGFSHLDAAAGT